MLFSDDSYQTNKDDFNEINKHIFSAGQIEAKGDFNSHEEKPKLSLKIALALFLTGFAYFGLLLIDLVWSLILSNIDLDTIFLATLLECCSYATLFCCLFFVAFKAKKEVFAGIKNKSNYVSGLVMGFIAIAIEIVLSMIISLFYQPEVNSNQEIVNLLVSNYPTLMFIMVVVIGPFCEELTYRVGLYNLLSIKNEKVGFLLSGFIFAFVHIGFTDTTFLAEITAFPIYLAIAYTLNYSYKKYGIAGSYITHFLINLISFIGIVLPKGFIL